MKISTSQQIRPFMAFCGEFIVIFFCLAKALIETTLFAISVAFILAVFSTFNSHDFYSDLYINLVFGLGVSVAVCALAYSFLLIYRSIIAKEKLRSEDRIPKK